MEDYRELLLELDNLDELLDKVNAEMRNENYEPEWILIEHTTGYAEFSNGTETRTIWASYIDEAFNKED